MGRQANNPPFYFLILGRLSTPFERFFCQSSPMKRPSNQERAYSACIDGSSEEGCAPLYTSLSFRGMESKSTRHAPTQTRATTLVTPRMLIRKIVNPPPWEMMVSM